MASTFPKFVISTSGRKEAVLLDWGEYRRMLRKIEDLEDAMALDRAEQTSKKMVPYAEVHRRLKRAGKL
jgi:L-rhamnose isomerase